MKLKRWRRVLLREIATIKVGATPRRDDPSNWGGTIPWIGTGLVDFGWIRKPDEYITATALKNSSAHVMPEGTILMAMFGQGATRGRVARLGIAAAFNQACASISPLSGVDSGFVYHTLAHNYSKIRYLANTGSQANLNADLVGSIELALPPDNLQQWIGRLGDMHEARRETISSLIDAKRRFKRAMIQHLFQNGHSDCWSEDSLRAFFEERQERNARGQTDLVLSCTKLQGIIPQADRFSKRLASKTIAHYRIARRGDLVFDPMLLWDGSYGFQESFEIGVVSPAYAVLIAKRPDLVPFLKAALETPKVRHDFQRISKGTNQRRRKAEVRDFLSIGIRVPKSVEVQLSIGKLCSSLDAELQSLRLLSDAYERQNRAVLDKLLSGELPVPSA